MGISIKGVPVKVYNSIRMVERYYSLLWRAYQIIITEIPNINKEIGLQMAFKVINNLASPKGLVPILLVFKAYPQMVKSDALSPTIIQRAAAIKKAIVEI